MKTRFQTDRRRQKNPFSAVCSASTILLRRQLSKLFVVGLVIIPLAMIGSVVAMFLFALVKGAGAAFILPAFIQLIGGIITSLIPILMLRIYCECVSVLFQVKEDLQILKREQGVG